jgi:hypothetical protein
LRTLNVIAESRLDSTPRTADEVELRRPGLSELEATELRRQLPGLADDYVEIARTWRLDGISIGYFNLWPRRFGKRSGLAASLLGVNSPENPDFGTLRSFQMLEVSTWEGDPICLGAKHTGRAGQAFRLSSSEDLSSQPRFLAKNFGDLLKAATQLHAFSLSGQGPLGVDNLILAIGAYIPNLALDEWRVGINGYRRASLNHGGRAGIPPTQPPQATPRQPVT